MSVEKRLVRITEVSSNENLETDEPTKKSLAYLSTESISDDIVKRGYVQWTTNDKINFIPSGYSVPKLSPGVYSINVSQSGYYFNKQNVVTKDILRFPQTNCDLIVGEIEKFWQKQQLFKDYRLNHQRGILLYGPAGSGKSSCINLIIQDVIKRNGIAVKFTYPDYFVDGMQILRKIEPETPIVVLMEDIDTTIQKYNESDVLNILDGIDQINSVVYVATTNYPELLGQRIINRPSRFDKRFYIGLPNAESRKIYFDYLIGINTEAKLNIDVNKWVTDTKGYTFAHMKELFVSVAIMGESYYNTLTTLNEMRTLTPDSSDDDKVESGLKD